MCVHLGLFYCCSITVFSLLTDTKNSVGLVGCIEEVAHNAIAVYWNPLESAAKVGCPKMHIRVIY